jgi:hypothetical protein
VHFPKPSASYCPEYPYPYHECLVSASHTHGIGVPGALAITHALRSSPDLNPDFELVGLTLAVYDEISSPSLSPCHAAHGVKKPAHSGCDVKGAHHHSSASAAKPKDRRTVTAGAASIHEDHDRDRDITVTLSLCHSMQSGKHKQKERHAAACGGGSSSSSSRPEARNIHASMSCEMEHEAKTARKAGNENHDGVTVCKAASHGADIDTLRYSDSREGCQAEALVRGDFNVDIHTVALNRGDFNVDIHTVALNNGSPDSTMMTEGSHASSLAPESHDDTHHDNNTVTGQNVAEMSTESCMTQTQNTDQKPTTMVDMDVDSNHHASTSVCEAAPTSCMDIDPSQRCDHAGGDAHRRLEVARTNDENQNQNIHFRQDSFLNSAEKDPKKDHSFVQATVTSDCECPSGRYSKSDSDTAQMSFGVQRGSVQICERGVASMSAEPQSMANPTNKDDRDTGAATSINVAATAGTVAATADSVAATAENHPTLPPNNKGLVAAVPQTVAASGATNQTPISQSSVHAQASDHYMYGQDLFTCASAMSNSTIIRRFLEEHCERRLSFAMGLHDRLGKDSPVHGLMDEIACAISWSRGSMWHVDKPP